MKHTTDRYAVFGNPISHSKSPILHTAFADENEQALIYEAQCIDKDKFKKSADEFFTQGGLGLNITVPFKTDAYHYATKLSSRAKRAGAVNTLFLEGDVIVGDNTDGAGLVTDITKNLSWPIKNRDILIVGAGGAVRGVLEPLIEQKPKSITIVNRTFEKANLLSQEFSDLYPVKACSFSELAQQQFDLIINGTSASLSGDLPPLPTKLIQGNTHCYDMMYAKDLTPFLAWAKERGSRFFSDGLGMLVCQGAESFFIWRGVRPSTKEVIKDLRNHL